jgi:hypothetical protein
LKNVEYLEKTDFLSQREKILIKVVKHCVSFLPYSGNLSTV